jgi:hypothetical protein
LKLEPATAQTTALPSGWLVETFREIVLTKPSRRL